MRLKTVAKPGTSSRELLIRINTLEAKVARLEQLVGGPEHNSKKSTVVDETYRDEGTIVAIDLKKVFHMMTTRQHAALQMLLENASNQDIADRLEIGLNGAKTYIVLIYKKLGIYKSGPHNKRLWAQELVKPYFEKIDEKEYLSLAGIPKNWHRDYKKVGKLYKDVI